MLAAVCGCDKYYDGYYDDLYYETSKDVLTFRNFSNDTTVWFIPDSEHSGNLPEELSEWQKISIWELNPHSACTISFDSNDSYETPVETYGVNDRMVIYVFKKSVWESHSWNELVNGRMWSGKVAYSVDDVLKLNRIVTYPMR